MPTDQRLRLDHHQGVSPSEEPGQQSQDQPRRIIGSPWLGVALNLEGELFPKEQILGSQGSMRPQTQCDESDDVREQTAQGVDQV